MKLTDANKVRQAARAMADNNQKLRAENRMLRSEVGRLKAQDERLQAFAGRLAKQSGARQQMIAHLRGLLRRLEWIDFDGQNWLCPECSKTESDGHEPGCELAKALQEGAE